MGTIVEKVIEKLREADIRADEAYPGSRIPALTDAVAAVRLGRVDRSVRTTAVQVTVMSPTSEGGSGCESTALRAVAVMEEMGATCVKEICRFDEMAQVFYIEIGAEFFGVAMDGDWVAGPGYAVYIGQQIMPHAVSFRSGREVDKEVTQISRAKWEFTLEELLPPGTSEPVDPADGFTLTVIRDLNEETFSGCTWTAVERKNTIRGVSQIRTGIAESRSIMNMLV